jgi:acetyltransferase-like isoleucine patch superfamily enzyme
MVINYKLHNIILKIKKKITFNLFLSSLNGIYRNYFQVRRSKFGFIDKTARVRFPILIKGIENVFLYEHTHILGHSQINSTQAKFIMKKNSASAEGLTVVTGNHPAIIGEFFLEKAAEDIQDAKDVIVEEDVWIAANVTLLAGVTIGRGAVIGAGAVCRNSVPPYAIVVGNPAKVVGFKFSPEEIIKHEEILYSPEERYSMLEIEKNYSKYFLNRTDEIKTFLKQ